MLAMTELSGLLVFWAHLKQECAALYWPNSYRWLGCSINLLAPPQEGRAMLHGSAWCLLSRILAVWPHLDRPCSMSKARRAALDSSARPSDLKPQLGHAALDSLMCCPCASCTAGIAWV